MTVDPDRYISGILVYQVFTLCLALLLSMPENGNPKTCRVYEPADPISFLRSPTTYMGNKQSLKGHESTGTTTIGVKTFAYDLESHLRRSHKLTPEQLVGAGYERV